MLRLEQLKVDAMDMIVGIQGVLWEHWLLAHLWVTYIIYVGIYLTVMKQGFLHLKEVTRSSEGAHAPFSSCKFSIIKLWYLQDIQMLLVSKVMRKTLLTSALAVIALTASAQSQIASPAGEFDFITKNLTVGQKIIPMSMVKDEENSEYKFTVYDTSFNVERSFSIPRKQFKYNVTVFEAKAPIAKKTILEYKDTYGWYEDREDGQVELGWDEATGQQKTINTLDDWKSYVNGRMGDKFVVFTDANGNFAYHYNDDNWSRYEGYSNDKGPVLRQEYWYFHKADNTIHFCVVPVNYELDAANLSWSKASSYENSLNSEIEETYLKDYDTNCAEEYNPYMTQSLFNQDEKFEVVTSSYKECSKDEADDGSEPSQTIGGFGGYGISNVSDDYVTLSKSEQDKYYKKCIAIVNEDGKDIITLPDGGKDVEFAKVDGKLYMMVDTYKDGIDQTIIYSVDNVSTSITELARTNAVKSNRTFNMAGMLVGKNAKGIVIQQGGKKYVNR